MIYRFGRFSIDCDAREMCADDRAIELEPRAFDLLVYLLLHRERVVGKDELLDAIWPRQVVSDASLTRCVMKARKAVGDDAASQAVIRTLHGHGYRFVADVQDAGEKAGAAGTIAPRGATEYARSGDLSIAYQVIGTGPIDIVLVNGWISNVELAWEHPLPRHFIERLASFSRLINFDKRGTGLSDRGALPTFEERMDDVRAVMDAAGSERAVLMGYSEGGPMCALFAATHPERTLGLVLYGTYMKRVRSIDYPWAPTREERLAMIEAAELHWDQGLDVAHYAPSMLGDKEFASWLMAYWRRSASPKSAADILRMNTDIDMCHVLPSIRVPTIVLHRTGDRDSHVAEGRYIAKHIPGARFLEMPGADHLPWTGGVEDLLGPVEAFVAELGGETPAAESVLLTLLAVVPEAGRAFSATFMESFERALQFGTGTRAAQDDRFLLAAFDGTGRAIRSALALRRLARELQLPCSIGVNVGECLHSGISVIGAPVSVVRAAAEAAGTGEIAATRIVRDLVTGFTFGNERSVPLAGRSRSLWTVDE
jgi:DNA-binding winged helix-turn-helix (wHTH) protein